MDGRVDLAIIIVTWNVKALALDALRNLFDDLSTSSLNAQVYVVDNASSDGTPDAIHDQFPAVTVLAQTQNLGFAAGNNVAMRALGFQDKPAPNPDGPKTVFLLNPDTLTQRGAMRALYDALFSQPAIGVVGAQLAYEDGSFQHGAFGFPGIFQLAFDLFGDLLPERLQHRLFSSRLNGRYSRAHYDRGAPFSVDHTLGATMLIRREVIEQTGIFDEGFYMYVEEVDWSMRIRDAGWQIYAVPAAHITHLEGKSAKQARPQSVINLWTSRLRLYEKHYSPLKRSIAKWIVRQGMRRKLRQMQHDTTLNDNQHIALINAYRKVLELFGSIPNS
jgi:N-acetylglucosaminyl-diphospho-decaprenol L-rhamnosyltransferase